MLLPAFNMHGERIATLIVYAQFESLCPAVKHIPPCKETLHENDPVFFAMTGSKTSDSPDI